MIEDLGNLIVILFEICIILLLFDGIMWILGQMFSFKISIKKLLLGFGSVFAFLWIRDYLKRRKERKESETESEDIENNEKIKIVEEIKTE